MLTNLGDGGFDWRVRMQETSSYVMLRLGKLDAELQIGELDVG